jgi:hypothetical protein
MTSHRRLGSKGRGIVGGSGHALRRRRNLTWYRLKYCCARQPHTPSRADQHQRLQNVGERVLAARVHPRVCRGAPPCRGASRACG